MSDSNNPLQDKVWKDLILRYFDDDLRDAEMETFQQLMEKSEDFRKLFNSMSQLEMDLQNPPYTPDNIIPIFPEKKETQVVEKKAKSQGAPWSKVAALFVLGIGATLIARMEMQHRESLNTAPEVIESTVVPAVDVKQVEPMVEAAPMGGGRLTSSGVKLDQVASSVPAKIRFNQHVRPILSDRCFFCHGPDDEEIKGDLRLDLRELAIEAGAIVPGKPEESSIIDRITHHDIDEKMPPLETNKTVSKVELAILKQWIKDGANYEEHWAYSPVKTVEGDIDTLVKKNLKDKGLSYSEPASALTLTRRMHLDVTGLPPKVSDLPKSNQPLNAKQVEVMADKLLASPHFGERMAVWWMDAVRYADTVGYHGDQNREASPYRDYIIHSFNKNKSFKDFTIEQLAGDLIPNATEEQRVGVSYLRVNQVSNEGGVQDEEYLKKYQAERVRATTTTWMGSTVACAECHNHKFDPFTIEDFYSFAAFFADILEKGAYTGDGSFQEKNLSPYYSKEVKFGRYGPELVVPSETEAANLAAKRKATDEARSVYLHQALKNPEAYAAWEADMLAQWKGEKARDVLLVDLGDEKTSNRIQGRAHALRVGFQPVPLTGKTSIQLKTDNKKVKGEKYDSFHVDSKKLKLQAGDEVYVHAYPKKGSKSSSWKIWLKFDGNVVEEKTFEVKPEHHGKWNKLVMAPSKIEAGKSLQLKEVRLYENGGLSQWDNLGVSLKGNDKFQSKRFTKAHKDALLLAADKRNAHQKNILQQYFRLVHTSYGQERYDFEAKNSDSYSYFNGVTATPTVISAKPRMVRILPRGNWMDKTGKEVLPATPKFLSGYIASTQDKRLSRLDLANWLVSRENPLTARVFVNRLWAMFFGHGLSKVVDDFGLQGEWPENPELLDWLAVEFMDSGWDVKHMVKLIVTSKAYQQSSKGTPELQEKDPENRWIARQSPRRLDAEFIRDQALASSGLLKASIGGRSNRPYQPAGYYAHLNFPRRTYKSDSNDEQYRRGVYAHWQRTFLHPMMKAFDAPSRDECSLKRDSSNTPLQALVLLNDPTFVEAARALAAQLLTLKSDEEKIDAAYMAVLSRPADAQEMKILKELLIKERERAKVSPERVQDFQKVGLYQLANDQDPIEATALAAVTRALYNLHETITRD